MKFFAVTLVLASVALANPAPVAAPEAAAAPAAVAQPQPQPMSVGEAVAPRDAEPAQFPQLEARVPKKGKGGKSGGGNSTDEGAAGMLTPSRALQLGAVGLGVMEVVRLWG
jgi:hypothetical protein